MGVAEKENARCRADLFQAPGNGQELLATDRDDDQVVRPDARIADDFGHGGGQSSGANVPSSQAGLADVIWAWAVVEHAHGMAGRGQVGAVYRAHDTDADQ